MDNKIFLRHIKNQKNHWWFQSRKKILEQIIISMGLKKKSNILDYGTGSGVNLDMLCKFGCVDIHEKNKFARMFIKNNNKKIKRVYATNKIKKNFYDLIVVADVIEHIRIPKPILKNLKKSLKKNGKILVTVPAYQFLFSKKDEALGHYRRYTKESLKKEFKNFKIENVSYFNFYLFFPIVILTFFNKLFNIDYIKKAETTPNNFINILLKFVFSSEKYFIKYLNFPFGISLYILVKNA